MAARTSEAVKDRQRLGAKAGDARLRHILAGRIVPGMSFNERVWALTSRIPRGKVATYGQIARRLGTPRACRAVGQAMNRNPYAPQVPCHRVVASDGKLTGYGGPGGIPQKQRMLQQEGVPIRNGRVLLSECLCRL
ncbi:MAG TPA: MGMT family protein [Phycisphaeraceae bacterium]